MREQIVEELAAVAHERFLVYLMGPYKSFRPADVIEDGEALEEVPEFLDWTDGEGEYDHDEVLALLRRLQGELRTGPGVNAFLAVDVGVDLDEMNAVKQTVEFARAANAVVFVIPLVGKNVGVGIEVGAVLQSDATERERVLFVHEQGVRSAMIRAVGEEWDVAIQTFDDEDELARKVRLFVREIMARETSPDFDLDRKD